ncbi:ABC transporter ATP-binding protein [Bacillaceae bacterium S4-13-56]
MNKKSTERRLFDYALSFKKSILLGLLCLVLAVALELTGPFIAKKIIDDHILGVEGTWYEVEETLDKSVQYHGSHYIRRDRLEDTSTATDIVSIVQVGRKYYMVEDEVPVNGAKSMEGDQIKIETIDGSQFYEGDPLTIQEIGTFFKSEVQPIFLLLGLYVLLLLIAAFFQFGKTYLLQVSSNRIIQKMRGDIFTHIQRLPIPYFNDRPAGKIVARVTNDTEAIKELYVKVLATFVTSAVYMIGIYSALFLLDARLAAFCLILVPILLVWINVYKRLVLKHNHVVRSTISEINGNINESIQGMPIIQAFRQKKQTEEEFEVLNQRHFTFQSKILKLDALTSHNLVNVIRNITFVGFIWYFGSQSMNIGSVVTAGVLYAFVDYLNRLFEPMNQVVNQLPQLEQARVGASRVFELMDQQGEETDHDAIPKYRGHIEFNHVSFSYDGKEDVLKNLNFTIQSGETVAFVGHTGSGKSSIMNLLFRFYDPQKGTIKIDGNDTKQWSKQQVRSHMGIVLQDPFIFSGTILSNVTMNDERISRDHAIAALKAVGADRFIEKLSKKYDEPLKEKGSTLSSGERQLISFARALAFDPAILILDEATANIDTETEVLIQNALQVLKQGRTTLVIAHRLSTIQQADQILVLDHGKIIETGNHQQLLEQSGVYYQMYEMQKGKLKIS